MEQIKMIIVEHTLQDLHNIGITLERLQGIKRLKIYIIQVRYVKKFHKPQQTKKVFTAKDFTITNEYI